MYLLNKFCSLIDFLTQIQKLFSTKIPDLKLFFVQMKARKVDHLQHIEITNTPLVEFTITFQFAHLPHADDANIAAIRSVYS